jgi:spore maturation protein SpmA
MDKNASSHAIVARITLNVMRNFVGLDAQDTSVGNTALREPVASGRDEQVAPIGAGNS